MRFWGQKWPFWVQCGHLGAILGTRFDPKDIFLARDQNPALEPPPAEENFQEFPGISGNFGEFSGIQESQE